MLNTNNQNFSQGDDGADKDVDKEDKSRKRKDIEREIIMLGEDSKKKLEQKAQVEASIRALKKEEGHLKVTMQEKRQQLEKLEQETARLAVEMQSVKKKMNLL